MNKKLARSMLAICFANFFKCNLIIWASNAVANSLKKFAGKRLDLKLYFFYIFYLTRKGISKPIKTTRQLQGFYLKLVAHRHLYL